jgi:hypothetical protein
MVDLNPGLEMPQLVLIAGIALRLGTGKGKEGCGAKTSKTANL